MRRISISQIDRLGKRLAHGDALDDDRRLLQQLLLDYNSPMEEAQDLIRSLLDIDSTGRLKTEKTIVEKLRRFGTRLSKMQDLAGLRVALPMTLDEQDGLVTAICGLFGEARVEDRRAAPSAGYRAVHIIVTLEDCSAEIQVRTLWQHAWADLVERLADAVGREIRYGAVPTDPNARLLFEALIESSDAYATVEAKAAVVSRSLATLQQHHQHLLREPIPPVGSQQRDVRLRAMRANRRSVKRLRRVIHEHKAHQRRLAIQLGKISSAVEQGRYAFAKGAEPTS